MNKWTLTSCQNGQHNVESHRVIFSSYLSGKCFYFLHMAGTKLCLHRLGMDATSFNLKRFWHRAKAEREFDWLSNFLVEDEYLNGRLSTIIIQIIGIKRDRYVQFNLFIPNYLWNFCDELSHVSSTDYEYSRGKLNTTITQILGTKEENYVQLIFFVHERMNWIQLFNLFLNGWRVLER